MKQVGKKLSVLLKDCSAEGLKSGRDPIVTRLAIDSRRVTPGTVFFALPGLKSDGNAFVSEAISRGAVAVVSDRSTKLGNPKVAYARVKNPRAALAKAAKAFFEAPDETLKITGITGTNGKTTVSHLIQHLLSGEGRKVGCLGTIGYDLVERALPSFRTTPEAHDLYELLSQMRGFGCTGAAMEVSSIGIDQLRVNEMSFDAVVFLNLTRDHLDYHGEMEEYYQVKKRLFAGELGQKPRVAVVNSDDEYGRRLIEELGDEGNLVSFGMHGDAMIRADVVELGPSGASFELVWPEGRVDVKSSLIGRYNVSNLLASFAVCYASGLDLKDCVKRLISFEGIPGRMERVPHKGNFQVVVDYAHTADALQNALSMLRDVTPNRLHLVFGCGGDRDRGKRREMTSAALELSDTCWATADNPRREPLDQIFEDMKEGVVDDRDAGRIAFVQDRRRAIELALKSANEGDCVLIAGKGHETFQEFGETVVPFDDRKVAFELLELIELGGRSIE
ncbi:MAG: UDP-N-acetylmuramoyl-L-alanyl-D-glutamate--2,6-diaminopimelate ligase [Verrucomicrobiota bacterium]